MKAREYQQHQLKLIAAAYRLRGYDVVIEPRFANFRLDALATHSENGDKVIIELINARKTAAQMEAQVAALQAAARELPDAKVDFRYIEVQDSIASLVGSEGRELPVPTLRDMLTARLPGIPPGAEDAPDRYDATRQFLAVWVLYARLLRAFAEQLGFQETTRENLLHLYNELLRGGSLYPPDDRVPDLSLDLFDLYDLARGALQGAFVGREQFQQLRDHVLDVRLQIRGQLAAANMP